MNGPGNLRHSQTIRYKVKTYRQLAARPSPRLREFTRLDPCEVLTSWFCPGCVVKGNEKRKEIANVLVKPSNRHKNGILTTFVMAFNFFTTRILIKNILVTLDCNKENFRVTHLHNPSIQIFLVEKSLFGSLR